MIQGAHGVEEPPEAREVGTSFEVLVLLPGAHEDEDGNDLDDIFRPLNASKPIGIIVQHTLW